MRLCQRRGNPKTVPFGLMYDTRRKVFWAFDTNSKVYVFRLDPGSADVRPLE